MSNITVTRVLKLRKEDFESIRGSETHATMMRNRQRATVAKGYRQHATTTIDDWLKANVEGMYYMECNSSANHYDVFFELDTDAAAFNLKFHNAKEAIKEDDPPPKPKPQPNVNTVNIPSKSWYYDDYEKDWYTYEREREKRYREEEETVRRMYEIMKRNKK